MKTKIILFTTLILLYSIVSYAQNPTLKVWQKGVKIDEFIYEKASFPSCHSATMAETSTGLVYAFFGGTKERHPDVEIYLSRFEQGNWSPPLSVADGIQEDGSRLPTWNPVLYQIPDGDLILFYKIGPKPSEWWGMIKRSDDGGKTWSSAEKMADGLIGPVKNKPILLTNGKLISPSSTEGNGWNIHFEISDDFRKSWKKTTPVPRGQEDLDAIQPSILDHGNGQLQLIARTRNRSLATAWSTDWGENWSPLEKMNLPNNNSGTDALTLADGSHVLIYNHVLPEGNKAKGARTPLNVSFSKDGKNWQAAVILEDSPISQYSYPAVIQTKDGLLHFAYTWRRKKMKHVVIDPKKVTLLPIENGIWPQKKGYEKPNESTYVKEED